MSEWNPLLLAIAFKKLDIVRYFTSELNISIRQAGKKPANESDLSEDQLLDSQIFSLTLAIANKDLPMFSELWSVNFSAWEESHLSKVLAHLIASKWTQGLQALFRSFTTETLFSSQNYQRQVEIVKGWLL